MPLLVLKPLVRAVQAAVATTFDKYFGNVASLMHGGNPAISSQIADETGAAIINSNVVSVDTVTEGTPFFNGTSAYITVTSSPDFNTGTGDFTIEMDVLPMSISSSQRIFSRQTIGSTSYVISIQIDSTGVLQAVIRESGSAYVISNTTFKVAVGNWQRIALTRQGNIFRLFHNGYLQGSVTQAVNLSSTDDITIGKFNGSPSEFFKGQIKNVRFTNGVARYIASYTPGSIVFNGIDEHWASVVLALPLIDGNYADVKGHNVSSTSIVNVPRAKVTSPVMFFNGTNAKATVPTSTRTTIGAKDFAIDCWVYISAISSQQTLFDGSSTGGLGVIFTPTSILINRALVQTDFTANVAPPVGRWFHFALTRSGTNYTLYIDGVSYALGSQTFSYPAMAFNVGSSGNGSSNWFNGFIQDFRLTVGTSRYEGSFTPSTYLANDYSTGLYALDSTMVQMAFEGANLSTTFTDDALGLTPTVFGTPVISTEKFKFGTSSLKLDGSSALQFGPYYDFLSCPGDFTVECWVNPSSTLSTGSYMGIFSNGPNSGTTPTGFDVGLGAGNFVFVEIPGSSLVNGTIMVPQNQWTHIALVRQGSSTTNMKVYVNGVLDININGGTANLGLNQMLRVGQRRTAVSGFVGYIDQFRFIRGRALYQNSFLPPTKAFEKDTLSGDKFAAYTQVLVKFEGANGSKAVVNSINGESANLTTYGTISTANKKWGSSSMTWTNNASVSYPSSTKYDVGLRDFTLECQLYLNTGFDWYPQFISRSSTGAAGFQWALGFGGTRGSRRMSFSIYDGAGSAVAQILTTDAFPQNIWTHVAVVRQAGVIYIYWDGVLKASGVAAQSLKTNATGQMFFIGGAQTAWMPNSFIDEVRFTVGVARYVSAFTPPTAEAEITQTRSTEDLFNAAVAVHFPFDTDMLDTTGNVALTGDATISTNRSRIGSGSAYFRGTGAAPVKWSSPRALAFNLYDTPFTAECWINVTTVGTVQQIMGINKEGVDCDWVIKLSTTNTVVATVAKTNTITGTTIVPINTWVHVALVGYNGKTYLYVNGVLQGSVAATPSNNLYASNFVIGGDTDAAYRLTGYINEVRITKAARYLGNFVPPVYRLPTTEPA